MFPSTGASQPSSQGSVSFSDSPASSSNNSSGSSSSNRGVSLHQLARACAFLLKDNKALKRKLDAHIEAHGGDDGVLLNEDESRGIFKELQHAKLKLPLSKRDHLFTIAVLLSDSEDFEKRLVSYIK